MIRSSSSGSTRPWNLILPASYRSHPSSAIELPLEKVIPDLFPLGSSQETPKVSRVDGRSIRRRIS
jgi:hypothetical protein